ncbi:MAG: phosphoglycerate kinase [Christensenellaceae bacterium]|jgi:phosphoglycerate kinase|nr:phosphoglycerate kinase [Christensenellaceae bacterium]
MSKKTIEDIAVSGKKVLVRCDFNVPLDGETITDETRITAALPTIQYLLKNKARVILCSHLGRPKGEFKAEFSLAPVAKRLSALLGQEVKLASDVIGESAKGLAASLKDGEVMMLENVRFHKEEEKNDEGFSKALASLADVYVNDAFGTAHRAHASTEGVARFLPAVAGYLIGKELSVMGKALEDPIRPFVAILGGKKVSDKIGVINNLLEKVDSILIGGAMSYTFSVAQGGKIGKSLLEADKVELAASLIKKAQEKGVKLLLPVDTVCADDFSNDANISVHEAGRIPDELEGLDIGPKTIELFAAEIARAKTIIWNGPMGVFELPNFAIGTIGVAKAMAANEGAVTIIGGGDSAAAVEQLGFAGKMSHISTGGGASLEFLEGIELPGVAALNDK